VLNRYLDNYSNVLTEQQLARGKKVIKNLTEGAPAYQRENLPPTDVPNSETAYVNGVYLADTLATWLQSGIVAGPYATPPLAGFRANSVAVIRKGEKIRPIINMSEPKGQSFNDNLNENAIEKVWMSTGQSFSYTLLEAGRGCIFSKYDLKDAFKNIPARLEDRRLQGFKFLGNYFLETQMIFGAAPSVANFDQLSNTLVVLTMAMSKIPRHLVNRTLDDITVVSPASKTFAEDFGRCFKELCRQTDVLIADNCPKKEKAFELQTRGIVLGIGFNSEKLEWFLTQKKADKIKNNILSALRKGYTCLRDWQKTMGLINNLALMAPFLKFFKFSGNQLLGAFGGNENIVLEIPANVRRDLLVCAKVAVSALEGLPIASRPTPPPLNAVYFHSDAAGAKFGTSRGKRFNLNMENDRGVACLRADADKVTWYCIHKWPLSFLNEARDKNGSFYGSKMVTLETIGLLLPLLCIPEQLSGKDIVLHVDNIAVVYGWHNGATKLDETASILLRALHLMASFIGAALHVRHEPRRSTVFAELADNLTRSTTTTDADRARLKDAEVSTAGEPLVQWLGKPKEDWSLALSFLEAIKKNTCPGK
jgi:hypothetical protein